MRKLAPILVVIFIAACAATIPSPALDYAAYSAALNAYEADSINYASSRENIKTKHANGEVSADEWNRFLAIRAEVQAADPGYADDLAKWRTTGVQPATYGTNLNRLRDAQAKMAALAAEVAR